MPEFPIDRAIALLEKEVASYQVPVVDLIAAQSRDPFQILVATILSARTRDEVTASACRRLFKEAATPEALASLSLARIEKLIQPVGFFRNKARFLAELPGALNRQFGGRIPDEVDDLITLPGVGRKTANLVRAVAFGKPAICVDTHVHRIMNIWGYVTTDTPLQTEMVLRAKLPSQYWLSINSILVAFGQGTCKPVRPHCDRCVLFSICPQTGVVPRKLPKNISNNEQQRKKQETTMKLVSWNVNGLRAALDKGFLDAFHELDADVFALQEIKALPDQLPDKVVHIEGYASYWYPAQKKGYSGTAVYTRRQPLQVLYGLDLPEFDREGRVLTLEYDDFYLVNIYFPNAQPELKRIDFRMEFNRAVMHFMDRLAEKKSVVACGDFNVAHKPNDLANPKANERNPGYSPQERSWMDEVTGAGYVDTFRKFNQEPGRYTWWSYRFNARGKNIGWRIDYFLVDPASEDRVKGAAIHDEILGSDHCPISLEFI
ncbi:MAG TPA: exodeoxyribonuclease III [Desulfobulbaceae bacterium]|nr:exodeoxyribonuclease III [Desulfobulbaceae bacterium]